MVEAVGYVAVLKVLERDKVRVDNARVLERASLPPPEGLASGKSEGQGELRLGEAEGNPLGWGRGFGFFGERSGDFGGGERWCWWWGGSGPLHDWEGARSQ